MSVTNLKGDVAAIHLGLTLTGSKWRNLCVGPLLERREHGRRRRSGRTLIEESREAVVVVDGADPVLVASRRARESIQGLEERA